MHDVGFDGLICTAFLSFLPSLIDRGIYQGMYLPPPLTNVCDVYVENSMLNLTIWHALCLGQQGCHSKERLRPRAYRLPHLFRSTRLDLNPQIDAPA